MFLQGRGLGQAVEVGHVYDVPPVDDSQVAWDRYYLRLAAEAASKSKDPSTKVGAFVVDRRNRPVSFGYNGFPRKVKDLPERYADRDLKYLLTLHAEVNAILFACRDLEGCTIYTHPMSPCLRCAMMIIQSGIARVVAPVMPEAQAPRWQAEMDKAIEYMDEAGVTVDLY